MNVALTGIFTKLAGSALSTTVGGRMYSRYAPQNPTFPYLVVTLIYAQADWSFTNEYEEIDVQFNLYSQSSSESEVGTMLSQLYTLFDDTTLTVAGYSALYCQRDMTWMLSDPDQNIREYVVQYNLLLEN